jgi:hypothetical protein
MPRSTVALWPRELARISAKPTTPPAAGVDIIATVTALHVAYRNEAQICVCTSRDQGRTFEQVLVATDAATDAIPTLAVDRDDNLFCWYHDAGHTARAYISQDAGGSFQAWATIGSFDYPRPFITLEAQLIVGWDGAALSLRRAVDGDFWASAPATIGTVAASRQLAALGQDRHGWHHLIYESGSDVAHRYARHAEDLATASPATLIAGKDLPSAAFGHPVPAALVGGVVAFWDASTLQEERTADSYDALSGGLVLPALGVGRQVVGVCFDRRDLAWMVGQVAGSTLAVLWSPSYGAEWRAP